MAGRPAAVDRNDRAADIGCAVGSEERGDLALLLGLAGAAERGLAVHRRHHLALKAGLEAMGLKFRVAEAYQLPQMNAVRCPEGVNEAEVRKRLLNEFSIEIGAGLGPLAGKIWRIGTMGYVCRKAKVLRCLTALEAVLRRTHVKLPAGAAVDAAYRVYESA